MLALSPLLLYSASALFTPRVGVRVADGSDSSVKDVLSSVGMLCAECIYPQETERQTGVLASAFSSDLALHFTSRNRDRNALVIAEDADGSIVGSCGIEEMELTRAASRVAKSGEQGQLELRPLLSSLAVSSDFRKRGLASRMCDRAEAAARSWGYSEVLLKVEKENRRAQKLYWARGYRQVAVDTEAERPFVLGGLRFVRTTQLVLRKDLRFPPLDQVALAAIAAALAYLSLPPLLALLDANGIDSVESLLAWLPGFLGRLAAGPVLRDPVGCQRDTSRWVEIRWRYFEMMTSRGAVGLATRPH